MLALRINPLVSEDLKSIHDYIAEDSEENLLNKKCRKIPYLSDFAASTLYIEYDIIFQLSDVLLSIQAL